MGRSIKGDDSKRYWSYVNKTPGCWLWTGKPNDHKGYGRIKIGSRYIYAHRYSYELVNGEVPQGLELDHLCGVRNCINPEHLEAVTHKVNMERSKHATRTHCRHGHSYSGDNLYINPAGSRACRACHKKRAREWASKNRQLSYAT